MDPANTELEFAVSVTVTTSGVVSVVLVMLMSTVSGAPGSTFRPVSMTLMPTVALDWYTLRSIPMTPRFVEIPPDITSANDCGP